jgi:hypothetical protein
MCRAGRDGKRNKAEIDQVKRKFRRDTKQALKRGEEPESKISVPYTD